jgi:hypothetical protein
MAPPPPPRPPRPRVSRSSESTRGNPRAETDHRRARSAAPALAVTTTWPSDVAPVRWTPLHLGESNCRDDTELRTRLSSAAASLSWSAPDARLRAWPGVRAEYARHPKLGPPAELDAGARTDGVTSDDREELARLRQENKTLREEREIHDNGGLASYGCRISRFAARRQTGVPVAATSARPRCDDVDGRARSTWPCRARLPASLTAPDVCSDSLFRM